MAATLLGGFWRGALACILSAVLAWWLFMSPAFGFALDQGQLVSLITFILVCLLLVGTVTALNAAVDLLLVEIDFRRGAHSLLDNSRCGRDFGGCHHHQLEQGC